MTLEEWLDENEGLVVHMANFYNNSGIPNYIGKEDLIQEASIAIKIAWENYESDKGDFLPFVITYIKNHLLGIDRTYKGRGKTQETTVIAEDYTPSEKAQIGDKELERVLYRGIKEQLSKDECELLIAYYGLGEANSHTYKELGQERNLTKEAIRVRLNKIHDKLKDWLQKNGYQKEDIHDLE